MTWAGAEEIERKNSEALLQEKKLEGLPTGKKIGKAFASPGIYKFRRAFSRNFFFRWAFSRKKNSMFFALRKKI